MSPQADYVVSNGTGAAVRSDINGQLAAIVSNNSGASAPATTYAYMLWADTSTNLLKLRNGANSAWITVGDLTAANLGLAALASPTFTGTVTIPTATISTGAGIPLASAASPAIYFTGDTNTGIYSPGADQFAITTGGSGRVFVDSSGRVGLGTSSPSNILHLVSSSSAVARIESTSTESNIRFTNSSADNAFFGTTAGANFFWYSGGAERMRLDSSGRVGIGTTSPSKKLDVYEGSTGNIEQYLRNTTINLLSKIEGTTSAQFGTETSHPLLFLTGNAERARIDSSGRFGIGTTSPNSLLHLEGSDGVAQIRLQRSGTNIYGIIRQTSAPYGLTYDAVDVNTGSPAHTFRTSTDGSTFSERARIDSSGRLLIGTSTVTTTANTSTNNLLAVESANNYLGVSFTANCNDSNGSYLVLKKSRGTTAGSNTVVQSGDEIGNIFFEATDGSASRSAAAIRAFVDATPGASDMPGRLVFSTCADGSATLVERLRVNRNGSVIIGDNVTTDSYIAVKTSGNPVGYFDRTTNDGIILVFRQDGNDEGNINVSGNTVALAGAHLSRWSQLPGGATREEILRGTVLSNTDEMCEWGEEENEQLNRMKVSDVEGDPNVAGVFQSWDDDDDTYTDDFYCAMTGDFIIRIAKGVTVQRGDLLMSAGDGTAKPQDDDIIRSKTVAKVTSTHVAHTHPDGSYCVPCVLMAC